MHNYYKVEHARVFLGGHFDKKGRRFGAPSKINFVQSFVRFRRKSKKNSVFTLQYYKIPPFFKFVTSARTGEGGADTFAEPSTTDNVPAYSSKFRTWRLT